LMESRPAMAQNPVFGTPPQTPIQFQLLNYGPGPGFPPPAAVPFVVAGTLFRSIEYVSSECIILGGTPPLDLSAGRIRLSVETGGQRLGHYFYPKLQDIDSGGSKLYGSTNQTRLYADPGTSIFIETYPLAFQHFRCTVAVSGYTVPK